jgi:hypothetical protein
MALLGKRLRITARVPAVAQNVGATPAGTNTGDINLDNILKLIPGDVVAIYLAGKDAATTEIFNLRWRFSFSSYVCSPA